MNNIDNTFLNIFKELKIVVDEHNTSETHIAYNCFIGTKPIGYSKVIGMVKQYQDEIVKMLLEESQEN